MSVESTTLPLHDADARRLGRSEFTRPLVLEAGAGTGKTAVLVARIVHWCLGLGWERAAAELQARGDADAAALRPEQVAERVASGVVAITFTDAAAVEMQMRVASALRGVVQGQEPNWLESAELAHDPAVLSQRAAALASSADRFRIQTIHGFCSSLLREHALAAGLHPRFAIDADGRGLRALALDLVGRRFDDLYGRKPHEDAVLLAAHGHGPSEVAQHLLRMIQRAVRPDELPEDPCDASRLAAWASPVREALALAAEVLEPAAAEVEDAGQAEGRNQKGLYRAAQAVFQLRATLAESLTVEGLQALFTEDGAAAELLASKAKDWVKGKFSATDEKLLHGHHSRLQRALASLLPALSALRGFEPEVLCAGTRLLCELLTEAREEMRRHGLQGFDGLLRDARRLLREQPAIAARVREGIDQLLVDEFQDTDAGQCELVARLALDELPTEARPGLFLVGDPKQSIYGWRNADLGAYAAFVARVVDAGGEIAALDVNFRSVAPILDEVQRCVAPVMEFEEGRQPHFQTLHPSPQVQGDPGFEARGRQAVEHWISWEHDEARGPIGMDTSADRARELEARAIAEDLVELHEAGELSFGEVALLMRSTTGLDVYLRALREAGVPYQVERDRNYYRRREVLDAVALVRAIVDPHDQLALVSAFRSPTVGVPDAAWLALWRQGFPETCAKLRSPSQSELLAKLRAAIAEVAQEVAERGAPGVDRIVGWEAALVHAVEQLAALRQSFQIDPADTFVSRLRDAFPQEAIESARYLGAHRLANLERFYRRLTEALNSEQGGPQAVLRALRVAVAQQEEESESPPGDDSLDAVRVMTVHKAKGLTFAHVYLADIHGGSNRSRGVPTCDFAERPDGLEYCLFGVPTLGWHHIVAEADAVSEAERVRLLYVALTRPQRRLVVCGKRGIPGAGGRAAQGLEALLRRRMEHGSEVAAAFGEQRGEAIEVPDTHGVLWKLPHPAEQPRSLDAEGWEPLRWQEMSQEIDALRAARADAEQARARRRLRTASAESGHEQHRFGEAGGLGEDDPWIVEVRTDPELARAVGTAVHRVLELIDLHEAPEAALRAQLEQLPKTVRGLVPATRQQEVVAQARALLEQAERNALLAELFALKDQVLGREVPVLLPDHEAHGAIVGTLDLLYRDASTGQLVVADFKTDLVESAAQLEAKRSHYLAQGEVYRRAVAQMFPDEELEPVFELWFLVADRVLR